MSRRSKSSCSIPLDAEKVKSKRQGQEDPISISTSSLIQMKRPDPPPQSTQVTQSATRRPPRRRSSTSDVNTKQSESAKRRGDLTSSLNNITQHRRRGQEEEEGRTSTTRQLLQRSSTGRSSRRRSSINSNGDISNQTLEQVRRVFEKKRSEKSLELERPSVPHVPSRRPPPNRRHSIDDIRQYHHDTRICKEDERPADLTSFFERKDSGGSSQRQEGVVSYRVGDTLKCSTHSLRFSSTEQASKVLSDIPINTPVFVKRTDRYWSYATLIERIRDENSQLTHVVVSLTNANGVEGGTIMKTKIIQSSRWPVCLMMVNSRKVLTYKAIVRDDVSDDKTNDSVQALSGVDGCSPSV